MKCLTFKQKLLNRAIEHLDHVVAELKDEVKSKLRGEGNTDEGGFAGNSGDYSARASNNYLSEQAIIRRAEAEQYQSVANILRGYKINKELQKVELLSLIKTNRGLFFIAQAVKPLEVDGHRFFMLATDAPIYEIMVGKKEGDSFSFRGIDYTIEELC